MKVDDMIDDMMMIRKIMMVHMMMMIMIHMMVMMMMINMSVDDMIEDHSTAFDSQTLVLIYMYSVC
jgi:hypothetical protein